jgi:hypothetical protein
MTGVDRLLADLRVVFGQRLLSLVVYGRHAIEAPASPQPVHTLALVEELGVHDLEAAARLARSWQAAGLAVPLMLGRLDFARSLDVFPLELGAIIDAHRVVYGTDPFAGLKVRDEDIRRACEIDVKGHLLHLREAYVESFGELEAVASLVDASAAALRTLAANVARLNGRPSSPAAALSTHLTDILGPMHGRTLDAVLALADAPLAPTDAARLFPDYLAAVEALSAYVDSWA